MTTAQLSAHAGVSLRQLQWWDEQGIVTPEQDTRGRRYSTEQIRAVQLIAQLRRRGVTLYRANRIVHRIGKRHGIAVIEEGGLMLMGSEPSTVIAHAMKMGQVIVLNVPPIQEGGVQ